MKILVATNNEDKAREILRVLDVTNRDVTKTGICHGSSEADYNDFAVDPTDHISLDKAEIEVKTLAQVGLDSDPEENGKTFAENARIKAYATRDAIVAAQRDDLADYIIIADDSGLCVDALGGEPGIHSARFAEGGKDDSAHAAYSDNNDKMLAVMRDVPVEKRTAHFVTAACMLVPKAAFSKTAGDGVTNYPTVCHTENAGPGVTNYRFCHEYTEYNVEGHLHGHIGNELLGENGFGYDPLFFPEEYEGKLTNAQLTPQQKTAISHRGKAIRKLAEILQRL